MKKYLIVCFLIVLFTHSLFPQAVNIPLTATDGTYLQQMAVGLDLSATNCIDSQLGESDLPPIPPVAVFDIRFDLSPYGCPGVTTWFDYRPPGDPPAFPFTGVIEHRLIWQRSAAGLPIDITYDIPPGALMTIKDEFGGIILNLGPFTGQGATSIPGSYPISSAKLEMQYNNIGGDPAGPIIGISPMLLNFPQLPVGSDTTLFLTVINFGDSNPLLISDIVSTNSHFTILPDTSPVNVAPLDSMLFQVINTSTESAEQGTIEFTHNAYGSPTVVHVSAPAGIQQGPNFNLFPSSLVFIQKPAGTIDSLPVTISNSGYINPLVISNIESDNTNFSISPDSVPIIVEPQSFQNFYVIYTSADSLQSGTIEFIHNAPDSPSILNVSSAYSDAVSSVYPSSLYFHLQPMSKTLWIDNTGIQDTLFIVNALTDNINYTISPDNFPIAVPPGSYKLFQISLNNTPGFQFGRVKFLYESPIPPDSVFVSNQILTPQISGTLTVVSGSMNQELLFGLDSLATDGVDEIFGEQNIPPPPPLSVFDARFILPENNFSGIYNSWADIRYGNHPYVTEKEYRIYYQEAGNSGIEISWDMPFGMSGVLQDIINGTFINIIIEDTGTTIITDPILFNRLRMIINYNSVNPVELTSFEAVVKGEGIELRWETSTEKNNSGFEIQKRKYGDINKNHDWVAIGFVKGSGTTTESHSYSFIDNDVASGTYIYRLKQIDFNGTYSYSVEKEINVDITPRRYSLEQNYPNPFNPSTSIKFQIPENAYVTLTIYNILGQKITELANYEFEAGSYNVEWNAVNFAGGIYICELRTEKFISVKKMMLLK